MGQASYIFLRFCFSYAFFVHSDNIMDTTQGTGLEACLLIDGKPASVAVGGEVCYLWQYIEGSNFDVDMVLYSCTSETLLL